MPELSSWWKSCEQRQEQRMSMFLFFSSTFFFSWLQMHFNVTAFCIKEGRVFFFQRVSFVHQENPLPNTACVANCFANTLWLQRGDVVLSTGCSSQCSRDHWLPRYLKLSIPQLNVFGEFGESWKLPPPWNSCCWPQSKNQTKIRPAWDVICLHYLSSGQRKFNVKKPPPPHTHTHIIFKQSQFSSLIESLVCAWRYFFCWVSIPTPVGCCDSEKPIELNEIKPLLEPSTLCQKNSTLRTFHGKIILLIAN